MDGYHKNNPTSVKQLIKLNQEVYHSKVFRENKLDYSLFPLLKRGLSLIPNDYELLLIGYEALKNSLEYSIHELPSELLNGTQSADEEACLELLENLNDFENICQKLGKDESVLIHLCRWHFQHYSIYLAGWQGGNFKVIKNIYNCLKMAL